MGRLTRQACLAAVLIFAQWHVGEGIRAGDSYLGEANSSDPVSFECPGECWECCGVKGWLGRKKGLFKCILRDNSTLPAGRSCEPAKARAHEPAAWKTQCKVLPDEVGEPTEYCKTSNAASKFVKWAWDKKSEIFGLANGNIIEMGRIIKSIHSAVSAGRAHRTKKILPLSRLVPIHPVDILNAIQKTGKRARAAVAAREILEANDNTLTQELITNEPKLKIFQSINVFYVLNIGEGDDGQDEYVTFEGNGRSVGLRWAFPETDPLREKLKVEVEEFTYETAKERDAVVDRMKKLRKTMGSKEFDGMHPPSLDEETINSWGATVKEQIKKKIALRDKVQQAKTVE